MQSFATREVETGTLFQNPEECERLARALLEWIGVSLVGNSGRCGERVGGPEALPVAVEPGARRPSLANGSLETNGP